MTMADVSDDYFAWQNKSLHFKDAKNWNNRNKRNKPSNWETFEFELKVF